MSLKKTTLFVWVSIILCSCAIKNSLSGRYSNEFGDIVIVRKNMTYKLKEKIDNKTRITKGKWQEWAKDGIQKIQFIEIPEYTIDNNYSLKIENSNTRFSNVKVLYKHSDSIISIAYGYGLFKTDTVTIMGLHSRNFEVLNFIQTLDSLSLGFWKYKDVVIKMPDTLKHNYTLRFYPTETISNFERTYKVIDNNLLPLDSKNTDKRLKFKKRGV